MFSGVEMRFESHLGHDVFPSSEAILLNVCTKLVGGVPLTLSVRAVAWPPRGLFRCVGGGASARASGRSACCAGVCVVPFLVLAAWVCRLPVHGP